LRIAERQGVEIDYCPECRGVWLDRGELDKIVERTMSDEPPRGIPGDHHSYRDKHYSHRDKHDYGRDKHDYDKYRHKKKYKKKHILKEILDILD
jgi:Zn-finger nucleic acid-binding protein